MFGSFILHLQKSEPASIPNQCFKEWSKKLLARWITQISTKVGRLSVDRKDFKCQRCGRCCKELQGSLYLTENEVKGWKKHIVKSNYGKFSAISFADILPTGTADLFFHPIEERELFRCPFLRKLPGEDKYKCLVQRIKPQICQDFPFTENGEVRNDEEARMCPEVRRLYNDQDCEDKIQS